MSKLLANYWFNATRIFRQSNTSYFSLYDDGRSANAVLMMGSLRVQIPKWLMRDYLSLSLVAYPNQRLVRRNPYHVDVSMDMIKILADEGLYYDPGGVRGTVKTNISNVEIDPQSVLDTASRANLARVGDHNKMLRMIADDIEKSGADVSIRAGVEQVQKQYGWTQFEVVMTSHVLPVRGGNK